AVSGQAGSPRRSDPRPAASASGGGLSPTQALAAGVAVPGLGQALQGQQGAGLRSLLAAPLILPWVRGARQAREHAERVHAGLEPARRAAPAVIALHLFVWSLWLVVGWWLLRPEPQ